MLKGDKTMGIQDCARGRGLIGVLTAVCFAVAPVSLASARSLGAPLACTPDQACFVQNYPDVDPGGGARDPACGGLTYDGHDGVDVRVRSSAVRKGVPVLAPIAGVVRGVRDGEADGLLRTAGRAAVGDRECGNGVAIAGADGLEVQLCHLKRGSVRVRAGERVAEGQTIGFVGLSGMAAFPHVHLTVRRGLVAIDPGSGAPIAKSACKPGAPAVSASALWSAQAARTLPFAVRSAIADWGFLDAAPAQAGDADLAPPAAGRRDSPALVFWAAFAGPLNGDVQTLRLTGPDGRVIAEAREVQPKDQAQMMRFVGRRTPRGGWPAGVYVGDALLMRDGAPIASRRETITLR